MAGVRSFRSVSVTASGAVQRVMGPNVNRVALVVTNHSGVVGCFRFGEVPTSTSDGIGVYSGSSPAVLTAEQLGPGIKSSITLLAGVGSFWNFVEVSEAGVTADEISGT